MEAAIRRKAILTEAKVGGLVFKYIHLWTILLYGITNSLFRECSTF